MDFKFPNLPKLSLWDIACGHTGQNAQDLTPTNETRHKLAELVQASRATPPNNLRVEFVQPGVDHGFITGLAGDGNRAAADADWRKLDQVTVHREWWEQYQETLRKKQAHTIELMQEQSTLWARRQPARLFDGPGFSTQALTLTTLSKYEELETWTPEMAAMLVSGLQAPFPVCTEIPDQGAMGLDNGFVLGNQDPFHQARYILELWRSRVNPPARVRPLDFIAWCKTKSINTAWLRSIEEEAQKSRDSVMSNDKYGIVQLPDVKLIHPELLAQLVAYAKSPIPDDTRLHGPLKKETPDGPHQWKIEPLSGEDWQIVNKLCGGKPPAPCSPQKFEEWRVPFDTSSEKPKWDFHPEFQPSDAMQRAQLKWQTIYSEHLRQLQETIAAEKLDLWTMDGLRTSDVYDHAALAYGHMRIDDAKAYLARCSIPFVPSINDLPRAEEKTKNTKRPAPDELPAITLAVQSPMGHQNRADLIGMRESATLGEIAYLVTTTIGGNYDDAVALLIQWVGTGKLPANRNPNINDHNFRKSAPIDAAVTTARVADLQELLKVLSGNAQAGAALSDLSERDESNNRDTVAEPSERDLSLIGVTLEQWETATNEQRQRVIKNVEVTKDISRQVARQDEERIAKGRYTLKQAAELLEKEGGERQSVMLRKLCNAALNRDLPVYEPGRNARYEYGPGKDAEQVRDFYEEARWDELNTWLAKDDQRHITFRFPPPVSAVSQDASNPEGQKVGSNREESERGAEKEVSQPPAVPSPDIAAAFSGLKGWNTKRWSRALGDPPIWLKLARVQQGSRQSQSPATWNPVKIALELFGDGNNGVTLTKLDTIFARQSLKAWESDWQNKTDILRF